LSKKAQSTDSSNRPEPVQETPSPERLYTAQEAMAYLRVSKSSFYRLLRAGVLKAYELPFAGKRFRKEDMDAALRPIDPGEVEEEEDKI
jgi:excisionase family DNA binding protein